MLFDLMTDSDRVTTEIIDPSAVDTSYMGHESYIKIGPSGKVVALTAA